MFDLHQGFTGDESAAASPTVASVAVAQLDVASALSRGQVMEAARRQLDAWRLLGRVTVAAVRAKLDRANRK